ncbi:hypothetical protein [Undibacterium sp. Ji22W]|uniref:hypothetical protein n=1 Tax=Undibacterium sp. Ji22W TaxID=3413038 RepID=UPI003BF1E140
MQRVKQKIRPLVLIAALIATLAASGWTYLQSTEVEADLLVSTKARAAKKHHAEANKSPLSNNGITDTTSSLEPRHFDQNLASNPFAASNWQPAPPPVNTTPAYIPPPAPTAPNFNYVYMGKLEQATGLWLIYLSKGEQFFSVAKGDIFDNNYRFEGTCE